MITRNKFFTILTLFGASIKCVSLMKEMSAEVCSGVEVSKYSTLASSYFSAPIEINRETKQIYYYYGHFLSGHPEGMYIDNNLISQGSLDGVTLAPDFMLKLAVAIQLEHTNRYRDRYEAPGFSNTIRNLGLILDQFTIPQGIKLTPDQEAALGFLYDKAWYQEDKLQLLEQRFPKQPEAPREGEAGGASGSGAAPEAAAPKPEERAAPKAGQAKAPAPEVTFGGTSGSGEMRKALPEAPKATPEVPVVGGTRGLTLAKTPESNRAGGMLGAVDPEKAEASKAPAPKAGAEAPKSASETGAKVPEGASRPVAPKAPAASKAPEEAKKVAPAKPAVPKAESKAGAPEAPKPQQPQSPVVQQAAQAPVSTPTSGDQAATIAKAQAPVVSEASGPKAKAAESKAAESKASAPKVASNTITTAAANNTPRNTTSNNGVKTWEQWRDATDDSDSCVAAQCKFIFKWIIYAWAQVFIFIGWMFETAFKACRIIRSDQ